ncbi:hypothetical protein KY335_00415 [Candidatus Woesearchaeota archaeon]|nr:hypothetical protein [Candidatus Woesearchaeota archaeon]
MLTPDMINKIETFVYQKPRSIQEIASYTRKNWRTVDRYVQEIQKNFGTISTRVFREGTRGALKIVFWASVEKASNSVFQEKLEEEILTSKKKEDFSAFDIFQHVDNKTKRAIVEKALDENSTNLKELAELLQQTKKQLLIFSGNLSLINLKNKKFDMFKILEDLVKRNIPIKIIARTDIAGKENIEKALSLNFKYGKELVEIRHRSHPVRAFVIDNNIFRIKEVKEPTGKIHELDKKVFIYYTIKDKKWAEWISRIFWKMFSSSINAQKRLEEMKTLK